MSRLKTQDSANVAAAVRELDADSLWLLLSAQIAAMLFGAGIVSIIDPVFWNRETFLRASHLPYFYAAFVALILLQGCIYEKAKTLLRSRRRLTFELSFAALFNLTDPVTRLFDIRYLEYLLPRITSRGNRHGRPITFLYFYFSCPALPHGIEVERAASDLLTVLTELLLSNFRGSDTVLKLHGTYFLVAMPDTSVEQAQFALNRLDARLDEWNIHTKNGLEVLFRYCPTAWSPGDDVNKLSDDLCLNFNEFASSIESCVAPGRLILRKPECSSSNGPY
jgi:GGDEF domain-containing protein